MVEHAMRVTVRRTRRGYVLPATHLASRSFDKAYPRMGERIRLAGDFDTPGFPKHARAILEGPEEVRHVRGRQRHRLADVDLARPPAPGPRDAAAGEGLGLRGGRDGRALGRGHAEVESSARSAAASTRGSRTARPRPAARASARDLVLAGCCDLDAGARRVVPRATSATPAPTPTPSPCSTPSGPTPWWWSCPSSGRSPSARSSSSAASRSSSRSRPARRRPTSIA